MKISASDWQQQVAVDIPIIAECLCTVFPICSLHLVPTESWNAVLRGVGIPNHYCVKVINKLLPSRTPSFDNMRYAANLQERLYDAGFTNIICPVKGSDGRAIHLCGGYLTVTSAWDPSASEYQLDDRRSQSDAIIREAARLLSRLHEYSRELKSVDGSPPRHTPHALAPWDWKHSLEELWRESATFLTASRREFLNAYSLADALICTVPEFFQVEDAQAVLGHGDFRPANLAIAPGLQPTLFDFDLAHPDRVETEIAYAALSFSGPRWFMGSRDWRKCKLFVREYAGSAGRISISSAQLHAAFHWIALRALSASFKDEQVGARLQLYREIEQAFPLAVA